MRFITEDELRTKYRQIPFNTYIVEENSRLTPGAKQFLTDFRIEIGKGENIKPENHNGYLNMFDKKTELLKNDYSKKLAIKLKRIAVKLNKIDKVKAEKLNIISINLFQGLSIATSEDTKKMDYSINDNDIFIDLNDERLDVILDLLEFDMDLSKRIDSFSKRIDKTVDEKELFRLNNYLFTTRCLKHEINLVMEEFSKDRVQK